MVEWSMSRWGSPTPTWPATLLLPQQVLDADEALKEVQGQWRMMALALSYGLVHQESAVLCAEQHVDSSPEEAGQAFPSLRVENNA